MAEFHSPISLPLGQQLPAHQDPWGLLLLRLGPARAQPRPRQELRRDGPGHDRRHLVSRRGSMDGRKERWGISALGGMAPFSKGEK